MAVRNSSPLISVVIPTCNKSPYLNLSLASWCHQRFEDYEIVVVVDGATDDSEAVLSAYQRRLPLRVHAIGNSGRAIARNRALEIARGSIIVFCDDDRVVHPDFLASHRDTVCSTQEPVVSLGWQYGVATNSGEGCYFPGPVAARVISDRPELAEAIRNGTALRLLQASDLEKDLALIERWQFLEPWFEEYLRPAILRYGEDVTACPLAWAFGTTGNLALKRTLLDAVGHFDEVFSGWGNEDTELHYRLAKMGARTVVARGAINYHQNHPRNNTQLKWSWLRNAGLFLTKHPDMTVALYIQAMICNLPYPEIFDIVRDAAALRDSALVKAFTRLLLNHARELTTYGDMIA